MSSQKVSLEVNEGHQRSKISDKGQKNFYFVKPRQINIKEHLRSEIAEENGKKGQILISIESIRIICQDLALNVSFSKLSV